MRKFLVQVGDTKLYRWLEKKEEPWILVITVVLTLCLILSSVLSKQWFILWLWVGASLILLPILWWSYNGNRKLRNK